MRAKPLQSDLTNNTNGVIAGATLDLLSAVSWASHIKKNSGSSIASLIVWAEGVIFKNFNSCLHSAKIITNAVNS